MATSRQSPCFLVFLRSKPQIVLPHFQIDLQILLEKRRHAPRCAFAVEVDLVLDSPKNPCAEYVVDRVHDARQEEAFLQIEWNSVISHGPVTAAKFEEFFNK